jgi:protein TonB
MSESHALQSLPCTTSADMGRGMMVALALHLAVALAIVAWPGALPSLEDVRTVEVMFTQPDPPPPPPPEPARAEPPPQIKPLPPAPVAAARPVRITAPKPAPAVSAPSSTSMESESAAPQPPAAAAATAAPSPPAAASPPANPDTPPLALDTPRPTYPRMAKQRGWQGLVVLMVEVNELGCANTVTVKQGSGHAMLDDSAVEAVRRWHFRPARKDGRDTIATVEIPIRFSLSDA